MYEAHSLLRTLTSIQKPATDNKDSEDYEFIYLGEISDFGG